MSETEPVGAVVEAATARFDALGQRLVQLEREYRGQEDEAGVAVLLKVFGQLEAQGRNLTGDLDFALTKEPELADDHLNSIRACVEAIDKATGSSLELLILRPQRDFEPLVRPFVRLAKDLRAADTELIFSAGEHYDYEIWPDAFAHARQNLSAILGPTDEELAMAPVKVEPEAGGGKDEKAEHEDSGEAPGAPRPARLFSSLPTLAIISYPAQADSDTLQHALVGHELAHLALGKKLNDTDPLPYLDDLFETQIKGKEMGDDDAGRLKSWLNELACDLIGLWIIGPAFLFALVDYVLPTQESSYIGSSRKYNTHPSMAWRLERLIPEAEAYFLAEAALAEEDQLALDQAKSALEDYRQRIKLHQRLGGEKPLEEEKTERELLNSALKQFASEKLNLIPDEARYRQAVFQSDLPLIWEKLDQGISPAERVAERTGSAERLERDRSVDAAPSGWSDPIDWRSILNGLYLYHLTGRSRESPIKAETERAQRQADCQMCRGSIELSELLRRMLELKESLSVLNPPSSSK